MTRPFPTVFGVIRDSFRGTCLQILEAIPIHHLDYFTRRHDNNEQCYVIENIDTEQFDERIRANRPDILDRCIRTLHYRHPESGDVQEVKYWYTPFYIRSQRTEIPILEFQYRSWIPGGYRPVPIRAHIEEILSTLRRIQEERLHEIRAREDQISFERNYNRDDYDENTRNFDRIGSHYLYDRPSTPPPPRAARIIEVPVERIIERVVVQTKTLPLPKDVGNILIKNAREGSESCPIAAIPFRECEKLCITSCFHVFNEASLEQWRAINPRCPVCRCEMENIVSEERTNVVPTV